jgi:hypothetical protein
LDNAKNAKTKRKALKNTVEKFVLFFFAPLAFFLRFLRYLPILQVQPFSHITP